MYTLLDFLFGVQWIVIDIELQGLYLLGNAVLQVKESPL